MSERNTERKQGELLEVDAAAELLELGNMVNLDVNGYGSHGADAASEVLAGVATETVDNSDGSAGDKGCVVRRRGVFYYDAADGSTFDQSSIGGKAYVAGPQSVAHADDVSNDVLAGIVVDIRSDGQIGVDIEPATELGRSWSEPTTTTTAAPTTTTTTSAA